MTKFLLFLIIFLIFVILIGLSIYVIIIYNKLRSYKNEVDRLWDILRISIENQFKYINVSFDSISYNNKEYLRNLIDKYMLLAYTEEVMNSYIELERIMDNVTNVDIKSYFLENDEEINKVKVEYNNVLLKYNNVINMIPNKIVANLFNFKPGIYFISKK